MRHAIHPQEIIIPSLSSTGGGRLIIPALTWTPLVAALSDFLSGAVALLPRHRCPLTHPRSPLPPAIAGLRAAAPRAPGVPLAVGCNRVTNQTAILSPILDVFALANTEGRRPFLGDLSW